MFAVPPALQVRVVKSGSLSKRCI